MKTEYPVRALGKIIILRPSSIFDRRGTVGFGGRRRYRLLEFLRHARWPDFFEQPEGHGGIAQSSGCVFQLAEALELSRTLVAAKGTRQATPGVAASARGRPRQADKLRRDSL